MNTTHVWYPLVHEHNTCTERVHQHITYMALAFLTTFKRTLYILYTSHT